MFVLILFKFFCTERKVPPSFTKKLSETVEETEGNSFKLEGRVAGSQPLVVSWFLNNQEVEQSVNNDISFKNNVVLLQVKKSSQEYAGLYTCKVSNDAGSALCTTSVLIKGWFFKCWQIILIKHSLIIFN